MRWELDHREKRLIKLTDMSVKELETAIVESDDESSIRHLRCELAQRAAGIAAIDAARKKYAGTACIPPATVTEREQAKLKPYKGLVKTVTVPEFTKLRQTVTAARRAGTKVKWENDGGQRIPRCPECKTTGMLIGPLVASVSQDKDCNADAAFECTNKDCPRTSRYFAVADPLNNKPGPCPACNHPQTIYVDDNVIICERCDPYTYKYPKADHSAAIRAANAEIEAMTVAKQAKKKNPVNPGPCPNCGNSESVDYGPDHVIVCEKCDPQIYYKI